MTEVATLLSTLVVATTAATMGTRTVCRLTRPRARWTSRLSRTASRLCFLVPYSLTLRHQSELELQETPAIRKM